MTALSPTPNERPLSNNIQFSEKAIDLIRASLVEVNSDQTEEQVMAVITKSIRNFVQNFSHIPWFREQKIHDFCGYRCVNSESSSSEQHFRFSVGPTAVAVMLPEEAPLSDDYWVQRVIAEATYLTLEDE